MQNPETHITKRVREMLEARGCHFIKLSDAFTRGVPDCVVASNRLVMIEFKVDRSSGRRLVRSYKSLGLSGAQDHHIRRLSNRSPQCSAVVTDLPEGGRLRLWRPEFPSKEGPDYENYVMIAENDEVMGWFLP